jgi:hypothetical protein
MEVMDFLYAAGERYSVSQFIQKEISIVNMTIHLLGEVVTPSEICNYFILYLGVSLDEKMLQFTNNLCLHEMWKTGNTFSFFSIAYSSLLIYYEQLNHLEMIENIVKMVHNDWEEDYREVYPEICMVRHRLIDSARFLTVDDQCIARFNHMYQYSLKEIFHFVFDSPFESAPVNAENSLTLGENVSTI